MLFPDNSIRSSRWPRARANVSVHDLVADAHAKMRCEMCLVPLDAFARTTDMVASLAARRVFKGCARAKSEKNDRFSVRYGQVMVNATAGGSE